jgi:hypothetical protein
VPRVSPALRLRLLEAAPLAGVLAVACAVVWPLHREIALSHDHAVHLFRAWHFWTEMLGRGRLQGWSHYWAFGFPAGELSPFGSEAWVALFRTVTLGLPWTRTYALALAGVFVFATYAMFDFTRRHVGVAPAVIASLLWLLDPGAGSHGGWDLTMHMGVWPVLLGLSFVLLGLGRLAPVLSGGDRRDVLCAGLWLGAGLLTHPLSLVVCAVAVPVLIVDRATSSHGLEPGGSLRVLAVLGFAGALSAVFLVSLVARSEVTQDVGMPGIPLAGLGRKLADLQLFDSMWPPIAMAGLVGGVLALRRRLPAGLFLTASAAIFVLLSSNLVVDVLHAERISPSILKLEAPRMLLAAKLFWFPLAGYAAVTIFAVRPQVPPRHARYLVGRLLCLALVVPLLGPTCERLWTREIAKSYPWETPPSYWPELGEIFAWTNSLRQKSAQHYRIAYALRTHEHIATVAPIFDQTLFYKVGYTPAQQFRSMPMTSEPELLQALSVKYLVSEQPLTGPDFTLERTFGKLGLYRYNRYRADPYTLLGAGQVELVRFEPERIALKLSGIAPGSRLKLHVANYDRWQATLGGRALPISPATVHGFQRPILMEVPVTDGNLEFRYVRRAPDWIGLVLSLSALPGFFLVGWLVRRRRAWLDAKLELMARSVYGTGLALGVLGLGWAVWRLVFPPPPLPRESVFRAPGELALAGERCAFAGALAWRCASHRVHAGVFTGEIQHGRYLCLISSHWGPLTWTAPVELGRFLEGRFYQGSEHPGQGASEFRVSIDGESVGEAVVPPEQVDWHELEFVQFDTRRFAGKRATLRLELRGGALNCVDFRSVR